MIYLELFLAFLQVGAFTFGGGYGAVPLIRDVVTAHGWLDDESLATMIAVSESTPGPIMVNMATYVGSTQAGFWGALASTVAVVLPSFVVILLIGAVMRTAVKNGWVQAALRGLKACITGVILATGSWMVFTRCVSGGRPDWKAAAVTLILGLILFGSGRVRKKKLSPIAFIALSALIGVIVYA